MSQKIRNRADILSHGDVKSREIVLDITEKTLQRLDSYQRIKSIMHMEGDILHIGTKSWDLSKKKNVYLLGAGKACNHMAMAVDEVLGDHLTRRHRDRQDQRTDRCIPQDRSLCRRASPPERGRPARLPQDPRHRRQRRSRTICSSWSSPAAAPR